MEAKKRCIPSVTITDKSYTCEPTVLLIHTVERIIDCYNLVIGEGYKVLVIGGCDGCSYLKMILSSKSGKSRKEQQKEHQIFMAGFTVLAITDQEGTPIWTNNRSESVFSYRPFILRMKAEDAQQTIDACDSLKKIKTIEVKGLGMRYEMDVTSMFTMIDGKSGVLMGSIQ